MDDILLLRNGEAVYFGPVSDAVDHYVRVLGCEPPAPSTCVAEYLVDELLVLGEDSASPAESVVEDDIGVTLSPPSFAAVQVQLGHSIIGSSTGHGNSMQRRPGPVPPSFATTDRGQRLNEMLSNILKQDTSSSATPPERPIRPLTYARRVQTRSWFRLLFSSTFFLAKVGAILGQCWDGVDAEGAFD